MKNFIPDADTADELVAWLATETSLNEPCHFNVSVDDVLSELLLSAKLDVDVGMSCDDQFVARDNKSPLSWRNLEENETKRKMKRSWSWKKN
jgi:hypothetical protein